MISYKINRPSYLVKQISYIACDGCGKHGTYSDVYNHERIGQYNHAKWKTLANPEYPNIKDMYEHACSVECVQTILFNRF